jgi:hypothetical protein
MSTRLKIGFLLLITITGIVIVFTKPAIPQDSAFHHFADDRTIFFIPNFWNVVSNFFFLVSGILGIRLLLQKRAGLLHMRLKANNLAFFAGILLTAIGSCYYHLHPSNSTLIWDRMPMTIAFMAFFSGTIGMFINERLGKWLLWPLLITGIFSVLYWHYTESAGHGDLRLYFIVQFLPMLMIPLILLFFRKPGTPVGHMWLVLLAYLVAKVLEATDYPVYEAGRIISGHSLKHIAASMAPLIYYAGIRNWESRNK